MAHFAKVVNGVVTKVIVAEPEFFETFIDDSPGKWIQTSYNTREGVHYDPATGEPSADQSKALRMNYAGIGYVYDEQLDAFYVPKPYPSWVFVPETASWKAPIDPPANEEMVKWDEGTQSWVKM